MAKRGVIISGYFSPLHVGHLDMIEAAADAGDFLAVIVNNNAQQIMKKGKIIQEEADRLRVVKAIRFVDDAMIAVDEDRAVSESIRVMAQKYSDCDLIFANGGDRSSGKAVSYTHLTLPTILLV